eukprot:7767869-Pyramimonas_sp.AAC.1
MRDKDEEALDVRAGTFRAGRGQRRWPRMGRRERMQGPPWSVAHPYWCRLYSPWVSSLELAWVQFRAVPQEQRS